MASNVGGSNGLWRLLVGILATALIAGSGTWLWAAQNYITRQEVETKLAQDYDDLRGGQREIRSAVQDLTAQVAELRGVIKTRYAVPLGD